jgi:hypothetical protein
MCARPLWLVVALVMLAPAGAAAKVLYVGDSLGVGTAPYLREQLDEAIEVDAETGRPSTAGVDVLGSLFAAEDDVVVFDLGTNDADPAVLADSLAAARGIAGDRCLVIATLNRPPLNGAPVEPLNRVITRFAASDPNSELVDWRAAATRRPDLLTDGIHATAEGYSLRAGLFAEAIESCLAFGTIGDAAPAPAGADDREEPALEPEPAPAKAPEPERPRPPRPLERVAADVARAVAVGLDFG